MIASGMNKAVVSVGGKAWTKSMRNSNVQSSAGYRDVRHRENDAFHESKNGQLCPP
jgi:hypothetical protein